MPDVERDYIATETVRQPSAVPKVLLALMLIGIGVAAWFGYDLYQNERERAAAALKASDEATARAKVLEEQVQKLTAERDELEAKLEALSGELEQKEAELDKLKATYDSLEEKMRAEIKRGDIELTRDAGGRIKVDLIDKILFDSGEAELSLRGQEVLTRLGGVLAKIEDKQIQVSGHTDDAVITEKLKEKFPTNWELSVARAVNVVRYLSEKANVPPARLVAAGHGEYHPVASNANPQGRARNRRIEILLTPALKAQKAELPQTAAKKEAPKSQPKPPPKKTRAIAKKPDGRK